MTVLKAGEATLVGQVRPGNQDNYVVAEEMQLFAVADGMGGHRGGEVASEVAAKTLEAAFTDHSTEGLAQAVQASNDAVVSTADGDSSLKGMGTTLCAMALIDVEGVERLAVANVGDSRLYLLKASTDDLVQITEDHSLVETLYRQGQLTKAEAEVHPHRNILTRALGIDADVLIDLFELQPFPGDRYLICSDGLFNEVTEEHMTMLLRQHADPQEAADQLARLADEAGGRDNITVVVVDVEAGEGETADPPDPSVDRVVKIERAAEQPLDFPTMGGSRPAEPAPPPPPPPPPGTPPVSSDGAPTAPQPLTVGPDGQPVPATPDGAGSATAPAAATTGSAPAPPVVVTPAPAPPPAAPPGPTHLASAPRTRFTWRVALFVVLLFGVVAAVVLSIVFVANNTYYVGFEGDRVAIFKGKNGGVLFLKPSVAEPTDINRSDVPQERLADLEKGKDEPSLSDAEAYVQNLRSQIEQRRKSLGAVVPTDEVPFTTSTSVRSPADADGAPGTSRSGGNPIFPPNGRLRLPGTAVAGAGDSSASPVPTP